MKDIDIHTAFLRYPFCGEISRCTDRGFGFVSGSAGEEFIHLRDHSGRRLDTMEGLEGRPCAYIVGGHPFRHSEGKTGWDCSVVEWLLLDDDDDPPLTPQKYKKEREEALLAIDKERLHSVLSAEWYVRLWRHKAGGDPKAILRADKFLDELLEMRLASANGTEELIRLLAAICGSPWYGRH